MKTKSKIITVLTSIMVIIAIGVSGYWFSMTNEQRNMLSFMMVNGNSYENNKEYQVIDRNDEALVPTSFKPSAAANRSEESLNDSIMAITEMVKNKSSKMFKIGRVQTIGIDKYTGWHLIADEVENPFGPSPLSYYTGGLAANLRTQILKAAKVKGVELDNVKVEVLNKFHWHNMMSADGAGFLDTTTTNIIIESSVAKEVIREIKAMALNSWTAGEALRNETVIKPSLVVNGDNWKNYRSSPGTALSKESFVDGLKISSITDVPKKPEYLKPVVEKDKGFTGFDAIANMKFEIFAIAESGQNSERPYLNKIAISMASGQTWEIYADEFMGDNDHPIAPLLWNTLQQELLYA